jgi:hypothetical protein
MSIGLITPSIVFEANPAVRFTKRAGEGTTKAATPTPGARVPTPGQLTVTALVHFITPITTPVASFGVDAPIHPAFTNAAVMGPMAAGVIGISDRPH